MAKEQKQETPPPEPEVPEVAGPPKSYRLYIVLGFVSLMLFQMIVLGVILSSLAKQSPTRDGGLVIDGEYNKTPGPPGDPIKAADQETIQIGDQNTFKFSETRRDGTETFSLHLYVSVLKTDKRKFDPQYALCMIEVIDRVSAELRVSTTEERKEAGNTAIKARVKKTINDVLGSPWVQQVFFTNVNHVEGM